MIFWRRRHPALFYVLGGCAPRALARSRAPAGEASEQLVRRVPRTQNIKNLKWTLRAAPGRRQHLGRVGSDLALQPPHTLWYTRSERASERRARNLQRCTLARAQARSTKHSIVVIFSGGTPQANVVLISWRARGILSGFYLCVRSLLPYILCSCAPLFFSETKTYRKLVRKIRSTPPCVLIQGHQALERPTTWVSIADADFPST